MKMKIKRLHPQAVLPVYQTALAAGFDFHVVLDQAITLKPGEVRALPTGLAVEIPPGYEMQIRPRSGLAFKHRITMFNCIGTIDADFRDEMQILLVNHGDQDFVVEPGMRIAQGVVARHETIEWDEVDDLSKSSRRGGFGSTGQ
jgi:dUTP pyrophosphatase